MNAHGMAPTSDEDKEEEADIDAVLAEMSSRWHTRIITPGSTDEM